MHSARVRLAGTHGKLHSVSACVRAYSRGPSGRVEPITCPLEWTRGVAARAAQVLLCDCVVAFSLLSTVVSCTLWRNIGVNGRIQMMRARARSQGRFDLWCSRA